MTRAEHYRKAEELAEEAAKEQKQGFQTLANILVLRALTHATLANCRVREVDDDTDR